MYCTHFLLVLLMYNNVFAKGTTIVQYLLYYKIQYICECDVTIRHKHWAHYEVKHQSIVINDLMDILQRFKCYKTF